LGLSFRFTNCILDHSSFFRTNIRTTVFDNTRLHEVDFSECDLTGAVFNECDLTGAVFDCTNLEKADLHSASNYSIDPEKNSIKKAQFSQSGLSGLLGKYDIQVVSP
jgi:uncharacterized protein YjbI with pentapeptide repeats